MSSVKDQIAELETKIRKLRSSQVDKIKEAQLSKIKGAPAPAGVSLRQGSPAQENERGGAKRGNPEVSGIRKRGDGPKEGF